MSNVIIIPGTDSIHFLQDDGGDFVSGSLVKIDDGGNMWVSGAFEVTESVTAHNNLILSSASPFLTVGDGAGAPTLILDKGLASDAIVDWYVTGTTAWRLIHTTSENIEWQRWLGGSFQDITQKMWENGSHTLAAAGVMQLDAGQRIDIDTPTVDFIATSPRVTIGDGTGSPDLVLDKSDAGAAEIWFEVAGVRRWLLTNRTNETFSIQRYNNSGSFQDHALLIQESGDIDIANNVDITGGTLDVNGLATFDANVSVGGQIDVGTSTDTVITNAITAEFNSGNIFHFDMEPSTATVTITLSNMNDGGTYMIKIIQGSGLDDVSFSGETIKWDGGSQPSIVATENFEQIYEFIKIGSTVYGHERYKQA